MSDLTSLEERALSELAACADEAALRAWYTKYFGKQGEVALALKEVVKVPTDQRRAYGQQANRLKETLTAAHEEAELLKKKQAMERSLSAESLDVTLPGRTRPRGRLHVATQTLRAIAAIFADLGFQIYRSREVEDDLTNFELLNMPPHHPAATCGTPSTPPLPASCCERTPLPDRSTSCVSCALAPSA